MHMHMHYSNNGESNTIRRMVSSRCTPANMAMVQQRHDLCRQSPRLQSHLPIHCKVAGKRPSNGTRAWRRPYRDVSMANALFTCQPSTCNVKPSPRIVKTQMRLCGECRPRVGMERAVSRLPRSPPCPGCDIDRGFLAIVVANR
jgi:hypothetical protein